MKIFWIIKAYTHPCQDRAGNTWPLHTQTATLAAIPPAHTGDTQQMACGIKTPQLLSWLRITVFLHPAPPAWPAWFERPFGRYLAAWERDFFQKNHNSARLRVLQLGMPAWPLLPEHQDLAVIQHDRTPADVCASADAWPWPDNSIDCVLLPHGLDGAHADTALRLLAEAQRVLAPQGRLLLTGFNPAGYWRAGAPAWGRHLLMHTAAEARRYLEQAGLHCGGGRFMAYAWPWQRPAAVAHATAMEHMGNRWWPHLAAVYGLVANKTVLGLQPDNRLAAQLDHATWPLVATPRHQRRHMPQASVEAEGT